MTLMRWEPFDDLDRIFGSFAELSRSKFSFDLAVDVYEQNKQVIAEMHIPGIDPKKIDIEIDGKLLRISGNREESKEHKDKNYYSREIKHGSFERVITLPKEVTTEHTKATYHQGTLRIEMPIAHASERKKITVS